ncbi:MAG: hypothetical protein K2N46_11560 [Lachnospiraceae bacterium]|nr:hypothetical protein [Lachnospiraceae bacterium]
MREKMIAGYLRRKLACCRALENFAEEEKGASDIVAIMLVIVILIAVAAVFRTQLLAAVTGVFEQLMEALGL